MFKILSIGSHAALLAFFVYLQVHGASILGSDEEKSHLGGGQHSTYHK